MKKVISILLTAVLTLSSLSTVFAAEIPTIKIEDFDATAIEENGTFSIPITIDKLPEGKVNAIGLEITFDKTKIEYTDHARAMKVWCTDTEEDEEPYLANATNWVSNAEAINMDKGSIAYNDSSNGRMYSFTQESLDNNKTLVKLKFKKLPGATGETTISFRQIKLIDVTTNPDGNEYWMSRNEVVGVAGTVTLTAGPTDKVETVGTTYTGDLGEVVDGDTSDVATAIYAELNGDTDTTYKKVNWTVNATIDEKAVVGTYTSDVNLSGEATYYLGMVIQGLAQDTVTAVAAALAE